MDSMNDRPSHAPTFVRSHDESEPGVVIRRRSANRPATAKLSHPAGASTLGDGLRGGPNGGFGIRRHRRAFRDWRNLRTHALTAFTHLAAAQRAGDSLR